MAAPKGNQFWKVRSRHGRNPIYANPEMLWEAAEDYFEWVEAHPLYEDKVTSFQGVNTHEPVAKMRAMTEGAFCIFAGITRQTWDEYCGREDFFAVTRSIKQAIREQKFAGAAADLLNANIIARDLGLAERQEHTGANGQPLNITVVRFAESADQK